MAPLAPELEAAAGQIMMDPTLAADAMTVQQDVEHLGSIVGGAVEAEGPWEEDEEELEHEWEEFEEDAHEDW